MLRGLGGGGRDTWLLMLPVSLGLPCMCRYTCPGFQLSGYKGCGQNPRVSRRLNLQAPGEPKQQGRPEAAGTCPFPRDSVMLSVSSPCPSQGVLGSDPAAASSPTQFSSLFRYSLDCPPLDPRATGRKSSVPPEGGPRILAEASAAQRVCAR